MELLQKNAFNGHQILGDAAKIAPRKRPRDEGDAAPPQRNVRRKRSSASPTLNEFRERSSASLPTGNASTKYIENSDSEWETISNTSSEDDEDDTSSAEDSNDESSTDEDAGATRNAERVDLVPKSKRLKRPDFHAVQDGNGTADLMRRLQSFLPQLRDSNAELEAKSKAGASNGEVAEVIQEMDTGAGAEAPDNIGNVEDESNGDGDDKAQYVEMDVWPGVLEGTSDEVDRSKDRADEDEDAPGVVGLTEADIIGRLTRRKRKRAVGIEEV